MSTRRIYPVLIVRDAATTIEETLASLAEFPEVLVYDNGSSDRTLEICKRFANVRVMAGDFLGFGPTKNHAVSLAAGDWVLSIDADERVSEELLESLRKADLGNPSVVYAVERHNLCMGKDIRHAGWGNDWIVRLFDRRYCRFTDAAVHEKVLVPEGFTIARLAGPLWHEAATSIDAFLQKISRYSELHRRAGSRTPSVLNILLRTQWAFFKSYVLKGGFLDGWRGVTIAVSSANGTFYKHIKRYADRAIEKEGHGRSA